MFWPGRRVCGASISSVWTEHIASSSHVSFTESSSRGPFQLFLNRLPLRHDVFFLRLKLRPHYLRLSSEEDLFSFPWALSPLSTMLLLLLWSPLHHYKGLSFLSPASLLCIAYMPDICRLMTYFSFIVFQNRFQTLDLHLAFWYHREKLYNCYLVIILPDHHCW